MSKNFDTSNLNRACVALAQSAGVPMESVVDYESEKIIEAAIRYTTGATVAKITTDVSKKEWTTLDGKRYALENRYPDAVWSRITSHLKKGLQRRIKARGLSKQSWLKLAEAVGLKVKAPGFVAKAIPSTGQTYPGNAQARRVRVRGRSAIFFTNSQPTVQSPYAKGRSALQRAITGRTKYFATNLKKGVFSEIQKIARAYPGLIAK